MYISRIFEFYADETEWEIEKKHIDDKHLNERIIYSANSTIDENELWPAAHLINKPIPFRTVQKPGLFA